MYIVTCCEGKLGEFVNLGDAQDFCLKRSTLWEDTVIWGDYRGKKRVEFLYSPGDFSNSFLKVLRINSDGTSDEFLLLKEGEVS